MRGFNSKTLKRIKGRIQGRIKGNKNESQEERAEWLVVARLSSSDYPNTNSATTSFGWQEKDLVPGCLAHILSLATVCLQENSRRLWACGCFWGLFGGSQRKIPGKSQEDDGKLFPNREML